MRIKLITFANIIFLVLASYKDEALIKWPYCDFKEGTFEDIYQVLKSQNKPIPDPPLACHLPLYEWEFDEMPDFKSLPNSEISFLLDMETEKAVATFWPGNGGLSPQGFIWVSIQKAIAEIDIMKYSVKILHNEDAELFGVYFVAKQPEGPNYVNVRSASFGRFVPDGPISEESFLSLWKEHVIEKKSNWCLEDSSDDNIDL